MMGGVKSPAPGDFEVSRSWPLAGDREADHTGRPQQMPTPWGRLSKWGGSVPWARAPAPIPDLARLMRLELEV